MSEHKSFKHHLKAYGDLWRRYKDIFSYHWTNRKKLDGKILNDTEAEFLPASLSIQAKPVSPASRLIAKIMMGLIVVLIAWSIIGRIDIVVNAAGKVIPSSRTKTIACVDTASIVALHVEEGQQVKAGAVLVELDASAMDAERDKAVSDRMVALLHAARATALIAAIDSGIPPKLPVLDDVSHDKWISEQRHLDGQYKDFIAKLKRIEDNIAHYSKELPIMVQRADDYKELLKHHDVSHHAWMEKEQACLEIEGQLTDARNQRNEHIAESKRTAYDSLSDANRVAAAAHQDAIRSAAYSRLLKLKAPVDGTVQQLSVHTVGGVVPAAQPLMQIVPRESKVEVEAFIENKDIGFVQEGQTAAVKVDAFEYTKYGTIPSKVVHVSRDAIQDEKLGLIYSSKIMLDKPALIVNGRELPLSAGMSVRVEIKTGERRIIEYIMSPLIQHKRESMNER